MPQCCNQVRATYCNIAFFGQGLVGGKGEEVNLSQCRGSTDFGKKTAVAGTPGPLE